MRGPAARCAIDPVTLVAFIDAHTTTVQQESPRRTRKLINGHTVDQANDGRIIRRWRSGKIEGVTRPAADSFLNRYDLTFVGLFDWAMNNGPRLYIRNYQDQENT